MNISPELVRELLDYDPETGVLTWRYRSSEHFVAPRYAASWNARYAGSTAGYIVRSTKDSYKVLGVDITIKGVTKHFRAHRIAWMHFYGVQAPETIDHINRDALDNRIGNLRAASVHLNAWNKSKPTHNTSGIVGVYWEKKYSKWFALVWGNGPRKFLGYYDEKLGAAKAVAKARLERGLPMHNHSEFLDRR